MDHQTTTAMMSVAAQAAASQLPPGFRFHPTDEELILHYLRNRAASAPCPVPIIADVDIYRFDPWELPAKALYGDGEYYFFSPRDRKYPNGIRPNRAAGSGYWKATGTDKPIVHDAATGEAVGVKKALVFYKGRPPRGSKTDWIMHEYRLAAAGAGGGGSTSPLAAAAYRPPPSKFRNVSMRLDDWVLCRIYKKSAGHASPPPLIADYDHLDHDEPPSPGGTTTCLFDDFCSSTSFYNAPAIGGGAAVAPSTTTATTTTPVVVMTHQHHQRTLPAASRLPKIPSISDLLLDEYDALAQILDAAPADDDVAVGHAAPLAVHPSLNQLLAVGGGGGGGDGSDFMVYSPPPPAAAAAGGNKRKAMMMSMMTPDECATAGMMLTTAAAAGLHHHHHHHSPAAKRLNVVGSCFDAPQQAGGLQHTTTSSVLGGGGLNHHMLPQLF